MSLNTNLPVLLDRQFRNALNQNFEEIQAFMKNLDPAQSSDEIDEKIKKVWRELQDEIRAVILPEMTPLEVTMQVQNAKTDSKGVVHRSLSARILAEITYLQKGNFKQIETARGLFFTDYLPKSSIKEKKNIFCIGDSVTLGAYAKKNFGRYLGEKTGAKVTNYAVSGVTLSDKGAHNIYRQSLLVKGADLVIVQTSDDDWLANVPIGVDQQNVKEVYGALVQIVTGLRQNNPKTAMMVMTPTKQMPISKEGSYSRTDETQNTLGLSLRDYTKAIIKACTPLQVPCINTFDWEAMDPYNPAFRKAYMKDGLHPNEYGHELIYHKILESYYRYYDGQ